MKSVKIITAVFLFVLGIIFLANNVVIAEGEDELYEVGRVFGQINCQGLFGNASCVITDPEGSRVGYDILIDKWHEEGDSSFGTGDNSCMGEDCGEEPEDYDAGYEGFINLVDGTYTVEIIGKDLTSSFFGLMISDETINRQMEVYSYGVVDDGRRAKFTFDYAVGMESPPKVIRVATPGSLIEDIKLSRKIKWIDNDGIMTSLLRKAEGAADSIERGQTKTAENQLNALIREVKAQDEKHIHKHAVTMLIEDAEYLISEL